MDTKTLANKLYKEASQLRKEGKYELAGLMEQSSIRMLNLADFKEDVYKKIGMKYEGY